MSANRKGAPAECLCPLVSSQGDSASHLPARNNTEQPVSVREEDVVTLEKVMFNVEQKEADQPVTSEYASAQFPDAPESPPKSPWNLTLQDQALLRVLSSVPRPVLRVKPRRPEDNADTRRPHSSFIPSELQKNKREGTFEEPATISEQRDTLQTAETAESSSENPSEVGPSTRGIKRPSPGSGSFHFSITTARNRDAERPRSGSFVGVWEQARFRTEGRGSFSLKEKPELKDLLQRGSPFSGGAQHKSSALPFDKGDGPKIVETASPFRCVTTETAAAELEPAECIQKMVKESVEGQETGKDEVKTAFGIKLRSTSQSMRLRTSNYTAKPAALTDEQGDDPKSHTVELGESARCLAWKSTMPKDNLVSGERSCNIIQMFRSFPQFHTAQLPKTSAYPQKQPPAGLVASSPLSDLRLTTARTLTSSEISAVPFFLDFF